MPIPRGAARVAGAVLVALVAVVALLLARGGGDSSGDDGGGAPTSGLPSVAAADLPTEARATLRLIAAGGPYPYARDGVVFGNRERLLPREPSGYYREYTVATPGEDDRGARRIVAGREGERYYSADHYDSFSRVREGAS